MKSFYTALLLLFTQTVFAQLDSNYVASYYHRLVLSSYISGRAYDIEIKQTFYPGIDSTSLMRYTAQGNTSWGFGIDWDKISFAYGVKLPSTESDVARKGRSKTRNYALSLNAKKWRLEGSYRDYSGFFDNQTPNFDTSFADTTPYYQDPDLRTREFRLKGIYFRNKKKRFSYAAAYSNTQRQLKSAGSFIWEGNIYRETVSSSRSIIDPLINDTIYGQYNDINKLKIFGITMGPGFSYNLVILKRLFVNATLAYGFGLQIRHTYALDGNPDIVDAKFNWNTSDGRFSVGYNGKNFFIYGFGTGDWTIYQISKIHFQKKLGYAGIKLGYRFKFKDNKVTTFIKNNKYYKML